MNRWPALLFILLAVTAHRSAADEPELWLQQWGFTDLLDYDPDAGHLLGRYPDSVVLWDVKSGLALRQYQLPGPGSLQVLHAQFLGRDRLLIGGVQSLVVVDRPTGRQLQAFDWTEQQLNHLTISPDLSLVAVAAADGTTRIWELASGKVLSTITTEHPQTSLAFSPDGRQLLSGSYLYEVTLWDVASGQRLGHVQPPTEGRLLRFSDDGRKFLTAGQGEFWYTPRITVWDAKTLAKLQTIPRAAMDAWFDGAEVRVVVPGGEDEVWSPDRHEEPAPPEEWRRDGIGPGQMFGITQNHWLLRARGESSQLELMPPNAAHAGRLVPLIDSTLCPDDHFPLAVSPNGRWLLTGGASHGNRSSRCAIWNLHEGRIQVELPDVQLGEFHPDGSELVIQRDNRLEVLDVESGYTLRRLEFDPHRLGPVTSIQFIKAGEHLLTAHGNWYNGDGGGILRWDYASGEMLRNYATDKKAVMLAFLANDGRHIFAALSPGDDGSSGIDQLSVINAASGELLATQTYPTNALGVGPLSLSASRVAIRQRTVTNAPPGQIDLTSLVSAIDLSIQAELPVSMDPVAFSRDGRVVFCLDAEEQRLTLFDGESAAPMHTFNTPFRQIRPVLTHPGRQLLYGALDDPWNPHGTGANAVGIQDLLSGEIVAQLFLFREPGDWLILTADGHINGSDAGLKHVTWRRPGTLDVVRNDDRTRSIVDPAAVAAVLTRSLADGESLRQHLTSPDFRPLPSKPDADR